MLAKIVVYLKSAPRTLPGSITLEMVMSDQGGRHLAGELGDHKVTLKIPEKYPEKCPEKSRKKSGKIPEKSWNKNYEWKNKRIIVQYFF